MHSPVMYYKAAEEENTLQNVMDATTSLLYSLRIIIFHGQVREIYGWRFKVSFIGELFHGFLQLTS